MIDVLETPPIFALSDSLPGAGHSDPRHVESSAFVFGEAHRSRHCSGLTCSFTARLVCLGLYEVVNMPHSEIGKSLCRYRDDGA